MFSTDITSLPRIECANQRLVAEGLQPTGPPHCDFAVLTARERSGLCGRAGIKAAAPFQRAFAPSIGKIGKLTLVVRF